MTVKNTIISGIVVQILMIVVGLVLIGCGKGTDFYSNMENLRPDSNSSTEETNQPSSSDAEAKSPAKDDPDYVPDPELAKNTNGEPTSADKGDIQTEFDSAVVAGSEEGSKDAAMENGDGVLNAAFEAGKSGKIPKGKIKNSLEASITVTKNGVKSDYVNANLDQINIIEGKANDCRGGDEDDDDDDQDAGNFIHVTGNQNEVDLTGRSVRAIKVTGNGNSASLRILTGDMQDEGKQPVCVFLAGNQSHLSIDLSGQTLNGLQIKLRGNQSKIEIIVNDDTLLDNVVFDNKGNGGNAAIVFPQL